MPIFTIATLKEAIDKLAYDGKIFSKESQFQFDLAWELKSKFGCSNIAFEVLSTDKSLGCFVTLPRAEKNKQYTDLFVKVGENEYVAIELKYKTPYLTKSMLIYETIRGKNYVFSQGAANQGSYLFWKDVERLEKLVSGTNQLNFDSSKKIIKGYAVLLTNDKRYWTRNTGLYGEFFPWCGRTVGGSTTLKVNKDSLTPIVLKNKYVCNWDKYNCTIHSIDKYMASGGCKSITNGDYKFKYLVLEVT